ncbi:hypothetical protein [Streptomyces sp. NRRL S-646]|uniref:hypothetical protein n=1 Tax=Streptomyces sp. NRRL S-646 TaxID=1463917 RepID=UPI0004CC16A8|nr:hypothetical protein [Streptomyces sp. NRRL S-646]
MRHSGALSPPGSSAATYANPAQKRTVMASILKHIAASKPVGEVVRADEARSVQGGHHRSRGVVTVSLF